MIAIICIMSALLVFGICFRGCNEQKPEGTLVKKKEKLFSTIPDQTQPKVDLPPVVQLINGRNAQIKSLGCDDMEMKVWLNGHRYRLTGSLYYAKPKSFRMEISSILGKEVDVGSNDKLFWYWSRRDKNPGLHFASHADISKTRLKTPFNPMFLRATLGLEILPAENVKVMEKGDNIMLVYPRQNAMGEPILFSVFINKTRKQVDGYLVTNKAGTNIAACEVQEYSGDVPVKILYNWYEENRVMLMTLNRPVLNPTMPPSVFQMPNITPKKNMAEDAD